LTIQDDGKIEMKLTTREGSATDIQTASGSYKLEEKGGKRYLTAEVGDEKKLPYRIQYTVDGDRLTLEADQAVLFKNAFQNRSFDVKGDWKRLKK
jgi:hypothetical protein